MCSERSSETANETLAAVILLLLVTFPLFPYYDRIMHHSSQDTSPSLFYGSVNDENAFIKQRTIPSPLNASRFVGGSYRDECTALQLDDRGGL
ncbi:MAG: hypothetical protein GF309_07025, partial [Candidatus Lokiarchaeota archaeon]|nr:hypothetical protein [Candidatus Lokiarchaeota archaeon]